MPTVLLVEDNRTLAFGVKRHLELEGFVVETAYSAASGVRMARRLAPDAVVLDLMLPDQEGFEVLRALRGAGSHPPVLILTARTGEAELLEAFRLGADDYVRKPFRVRELIARIHALLRRAAEAAPAPPVLQQPAPEVRFGRVEVDPGRCVVKRGGAPVPLRPKELDLLMALVKRGGAVVSRAELLREVWGYDPLARSRTVDTHVLELRRKLEDDPNEPVHILTVRTRGYRLRLEGEDGGGSGPGA